MEDFKNENIMCKKQKINKQKAPAKNTNELRSKSIIYNSAISELNQIFINL